MACEISQKNEASVKMALAAKSFRSPKKLLRKRHCAAKSFRSPMPPSAKIFAIAKPPLGTRVPFRNTVPPFRSCEMAADSTHGSLALKAYQQNLYLEYYY